MSRTPRAWPRQDGGGGASAPTSRSPSGPPSRVGARPQRARVRPPSKPPPWGRSTGHRRTEASQAARATAPEARGAARSARCRCADASHPGPRGHVRCSGPAVAQSSAARSSSPRRHPRSCAPALTTRSPESAASRSDPGPTGASLPDRLRSDDQQPAPWLASAPHGASAYPLINNPGILNPSPSPGPRITGEHADNRLGCLFRTHLAPELPPILPLDREREFRLAYAWLASIALCVVMVESIPPQDHGVRWAFPLAAHVRIPARVLGQGDGWRSEQPATHSQNNEVFHSRPPFAQRTPPDHTSFAGNLQPLPSERHSSLRLCALTRIRRMGFLTR